MLKTNDVRIQGYPPIEIILSHYAAIPILLRAVKEHCPEVLVAWDEARTTLQKPCALVPATRTGEATLYPEGEVSNG